MLSINSNVFNNQVDRILLISKKQGRKLTYLERLERKIKRNFPDITQEELKYRIALAKHLIAMEHEKKAQLRKESLI